MNFLFVLIALVFVFCIITVLGHGFWLLVATIFRALSGTARPSQSTDKECVRCGRFLANNGARCDACGLDHNSSLAQELADLHATARQLSRFEKSDSLESALLNQIADAVEARQRRLLGRGAPEPARPRPAPALEPIPASPPAPPFVPAPMPVMESVPVGAASLAPSLPEPVFAARTLELGPTAVEERPWQRLERLLGQCKDVSELTADDRGEALRVYAQADSTQLSAMSATAQLALARLLQSAAMIEDALTAYRRVLRMNPQMPDFAVTALAAGRLAVSARQPLEAEWFLERAVSAGSLTGDARREAEQLLRNLRPAAEDEVLDALPVVQPVAAAQVPVASRWGEIADEAPSALEPVRSKELPAYFPPARPEPIPEPAVPRRSLGEVLGAFMEERNILWGELIGGLLIVGCSIALVISLWSQLESVPYFPFLVLGGITAALMGAGLYTLHHWKLESTSRGLLVIGTLLVPLDFMVMAGLVQDASKITFLDVGVATGALALFALLLHRAGAILAPDQRWLLPLGVLGASASQLLVPWVLMKHQGSPGFTLLLGAVPVACQALSAAGMLRLSNRRESLSNEHVSSLFGFLGMTTFAVAVALGFLAYWGENVRGALERLSVVIALGGVAPLLAGVSVHRRLTDRVELAAARTGGTVVALTGMFIMLIAVLLAWPQPSALTLVCLLNFALLTFLAFRCPLPIAHAAALPCLVLGCLTAYHWALGRLPGAGEQLGLQLLQLLFSSQSGVALVLPVVMMGAIAEITARGNRRIHGVYYAIAAGAAAILSLTLVTLQRPSDPASAMLIYGLYGAGSLAMNFRWRRSPVSYVGLGLLVAATLWGMELACPDRAALWASVLAGEALLMALLTARRQHKQAIAIQETAPPLSDGQEAERAGSLSRSTTWGLPTFLAQPLARTAQFVTILAIGIGLWSAISGPAAGSWVLEHVLTGVCLTAVYLALTAIERRIVPARIAGVMLIGTVVVAAGWFGTHGDGPHQAQALIALWVAVASSCIALVGLRRSDSGSWLDVLVHAWREMAAVAAAVALVVALLVPAFPAPGMQAWTAAALAVTALLLAWVYQAPALTWVGSVLLFFSLFHALAWNVADRSLTRSTLLAVLSHATLVSLIVLGFHVLSRVRATADGALERLQAIITTPLHHTALLASVAAIPMLALPERGQMVPFAAYVLWLAAFWLAVAWIERWPIVFNAFQAALSVTVAYAVTAWLEGRDWVVASPVDGLYDPRSLQAYGVALGMLSLIWMGLRIAMPAKTVVRELLDSDGVSTDKLVLALLIVGQLGVAVWGVAPGVVAELTPAIPGVVIDGTGHVHAYGPGAWALLATLAVVLTVALWVRKAGAAVAFIFLAVTVPVLTAGPAGAQLATASALRWDLGLCFLATAVPLWLREPLGRFATGIGVKLEDDEPPSLLARWGLIALCLLPVVALTTHVTLLGLQGLTPAGPTDGSFYFRVGWIASNVVPLVLLGAALVGHALRERAAGYAFAAGLLLAVSLMGGQALHVITTGGQLTGAPLARMLQLGTLFSAVWALAWLASRRWVTAWREDGPGHSVLMTIQIGLAAAGNIGLLGGALVSLTGSFARIPAGTIGAFYPAATPWAGAVGSWLGWAALALTIGAVVYRVRQHVSFSNLWMLGGTGLVAVAFVAVSISSASPMWGYRTLMLGIAAYGLAWSLASTPALFRSRASDEAPVTALSGPAATWVRITGLLAILLGIKASIWHQDQLWAAGAIALASVAGAVMAVSRRRQEWAFMAGLGMNVAASLVVWHFQVSVPFYGWWPYLVQANCAASGAGALLWLTARKRLYGTLEMKLSDSSFLAVQIVLGFVGNIVLLGLAAAALFVMPGSASTTVDVFGHAGGGMALLLPMAAAFWHAVRATMPQRFAVFGVSGLLFGILAAASAAPWDTGNYLCYNVWTVSWATIGLLTLGLGLVAVAFRLTAADQEPGEPVAEGAEMNAQPPAFIRFVLESVPQIQRWVEIIGLLVVVLAMRGTTDPKGPYWSAGAALAVSLMAVGMALWSRRQRHVYEFGLLVDLAGIIVWMYHPSPSLTGFVAMNVFCLAVAATFWAALDLALRANSWMPELRGGRLPFNRVATLLALSGLALLVSLGVFSDLTQSGLELPAALTWAALIATTAAVTIAAWDPSVRFTSAGLYALGLMLIGLVFNGQNLKPERYGWAAALVLVGYVGLTSLLAWAAPRLSSVWQALRLPERSTGSDIAWLSPIQIGVACVVIALSVWISLEFEQLGQRLAGPLAAVVLLPAAALLAGRFVARRAQLFRTATLTLGVLVIAELGWVLLGHNAPAILLHRTVLLMAGLAVMTGVYAVGLRGVSEAWVKSARRLGPVLMMLATILLLSVLLQEAALYNPDP
ncbi:MAG: hypothetical protein K2R98_09615, partial [Gemmataceae bacterium]|nr:hypothetical protein [Gemmataceae bacterium]